MSQTIQGCHKCGGHPQHQIERLQRYKIFKCNQCQTITCNEHLIGLAGNQCPNCLSSSLTCLATKDYKQKYGAVKSKDSQVHARTSTKAAALQSTPTQVPPRAGTGVGVVQLSPIEVSARGHTSTPASILSPIEVSPRLGGLGVDAPLALKSPTEVSSATFNPAEISQVPVGKTLAADFVESMTGGGLDKLKAQMVTSVVEHHGDSEYTHHHEHQHTHSGQMVGPEEEALRLENKAAEVSGHNPKTSNSGMIAPAVQHVDVGVSSQHQDSATTVIEAPEDLPDPASLRSGVTVYADACFRPSVDDKLISLGKLLEQIDAQLTTGKDIKVVNLALDFYDVKRSMAELLAFLQKFPFVRLTVGYGPKHATDEDLDFDGLQQFINTTPHVIALDTGIDLHFAAYSKNAQVALLRKQLELANHLGKPVFLSAVKADEVLAEAIHQPIKGVYASPLLSETALNLCKKHNLWVCTRSEITQASQDTYRQLLAKIPTGKLLLGSGSELVAPAGHKAMTNSPLSIDDTARVLMQLYRYQKLETLYSQCYKNLYGLLMGL